MFTGLLVRVREREGTVRVSVECVSSVCKYDSLSLLYSYNFHHTAQNVFSTSQRHIA